MGDVLRSCLDFTANKFKNELFGLFAALFGIFVLSILANRPLFAANREYKTTQKNLSTKLEIKSKQLLNIAHESTRIDTDLGETLRPRAFGMFAVLW